jgi:hypothetical protein
MQRGNSLGRDLINAAMEHIRCDRGLEDCTCYMVFTRQRSGLLPIFRLEFNSISY